MERSALGPRTSLLSLSSWLLPCSYIYPAPWISTFLSSHTCAYHFQRRSPHTQADRLSRLPTFMPTLFHVDPHTSAYFITLHLSIHVYSFRHSSPIFPSTPSGSQDLNVNVQLIFSNPARAHIADEFYSGSNPFIEARHSSPCTRPPS